jgi:Flp pilus assembly protein TadG
VRRGIRHDAEGATVVEFALVAPVLVMTLLAMFDMGYGMWAQTMLQGALQDAARASTMESANTQLTGIDAIITHRVKQLVPDATMAFKRKSYTSFGDVGRAEDYTDSNGNGACDAGEPYEDANGNGAWDTDRGQLGNGGARDAVVYSVSATYPRPFPFMAMVGLSKTVTVSAQTVLRNQPFKLQAVSNKVGHCA